MTGIGSWQGTWPRSSLHAGNPGRCREKRSSNHIGRRRAMQLIRISGAALLFLLSGCSVASRMQPAPPRAGASRLILPGEEDATQRGSLLDLIRRRLPVVVQSGRFMIDGQLTSVCIHARRSGRAVGMRTGSSGPPGCPTIDAFVDGMRIGDVGAFLARAQATEFESIEFVSTASAGRDVAAGGPGEALILWTRGRGPYSGRRRRISARPPRGPKRRRARTPAPPPPRPAAPFPSNRRS